MAQLAGGALALSLPGADADEHAAVEVDGEREERLDVATVAVRVGLDALQHDPQRHLVAALGL